MKAIILAAGLGSRLRPITNIMPKCMVSVNNQPIIDKQIKNLLCNEIKESDIYVVGGYKGEVLLDYLKRNYPEINFIPNPRYAETNNMYSLYLGMKEMPEDDFLLMNADVFFDANVIKGIKEVETPSAIACDRSRFLDESMKICVDSYGNVTHISKAISEQEHFAVSIDVYKISKKARNILFETVKDFIEKKKDENSWTEVALDQIFDKIVFSPYVIKGRWFEIDNHDDLKAAEALFES